MLKKGKAIDDLAYLNIAGDTNNLNVHEPSGYIC